MKTIFNVFLTTIKNWYKVLIVTLIIFESILFISNNLSNITMQIFTFICMVVVILLLKYKVEKDLYEN